MSLTFHYPISIRAGLNLKIEFYSEPFNPATFFKHLNNCDIIVAWMKKS